jgi:hypothetical protein
VPPAFRPALEAVVQRTDPAGDTGEASGMAGLCLSPVIENRGLTGFRPWPGQQIVRLLVDRAWQEPQIVVGCFFDFFDTGPTGPSVHIWTFDRTYDERTAC